VRAVVTQGRRTMRVVDVSGPREPGAGEVVVRPEAVGLCGSDLHYFLGDIGAVSDSELYPRVHWHEAAGIVELLAAEEGVDVVVAAREWTGGEGPEVVFEATGVPDVVRTAVELVSQAGRVIVVGALRPRCSAQDR
jgi:threonine dehydrogenase-like Zn-dependent dehydrogenase